MTADVELLHKIVDRLAADLSYERGQAVEDLLEALAQQPAACRCVDCGGDQPGHDPHCAYMRDLHGAQPAAVNEAMVERALAAYLRRQEDGESLYGCVTAALTAALATQHGDNT